MKMGHLQVMNGVRLTHGICPVLALSMFLKTLLLACSIFFSVLTALPNVFLFIVYPSFLSLNNC
jgi:hypothetical protein